MGKMDNGKKPPEGNREALRQLPGVDRLLRHERLVAAIGRYGPDLVKFAAQRAIAHAREEILGHEGSSDLEGILADTEQRCRAVAVPSLRPVVNATGILIHTNLGRAPLGKRILDDLHATVGGYTNLELDLATGARGHRKAHLQSLLCYITGAEDAVVVNNNAAALVLTLSTLAKDREVIVSRGELIEIGGSFRIPDILAASGAHMIEVGTTNRTRVADYEKAVTDRTALLLKAHRSNFAIHGFTEEPSLEELVALGRARKIPVVYDIGSGLLRKPKNLPLADEPDVQGALAQGVDLLTFSGDKLLGGPQAGIVVGRKDLVARLGKAPLMRALRVGKLTIAALSSAARSYLDDHRLVESLPLFAMMSADPDALRQKAEALLARFTHHGVGATIVASSGRCGGGTLPDLEIPSFAVVVKSEAPSQQKRSAFAERLFHALLDLEHPILGILRQGELLLDVLTIDPTDFDHVSGAVSQAITAAGPA